MKPEEVFCKYRMDNQALLCNSWVVAHIVRAFYGQQRVVAMQQTCIETIQSVRHRFGVSSTSFPEAISI